MKKVYVFAFVLLIIVALLAASPAVAGVGYSNLVCASEGGSWSGAPGSTGDCTWASNSSTAIAACGPDNTYTRSFASGNPTGSTCTPDFGSALPSPELDCGAAGGTWVGSDSDNGDCTYAAGSSAAVFACGSGYEYTETYVAGIFSAGSCTAAGSSSSDEDDTDSDGGEVSGLADTPVTLTLGGGNNGSATFSPDACPQKCTIGPTLPAGAKAMLPDDAVATMYVRVVNEGGTAGGGSYTICFKNPENQPLVIYKNIAGVWVALSFPSVSNQVCVTSSGDGAFYLGN